MLVLHGIYDEQTDQNKTFKESLLKGPVLSKKELSGIIKAEKRIQKWKIPEFYSHLECQTF